MLPRLNPADRFQPHAGAEGQFGLHPAAADAIADQIAGDGNIDCRAVRYDVFLPESRRMAIRRVFSSTIPSGSKSPNPGPTPSALCRDIA